MKALLVLALFLACFGKLYPYNALNARDCSPDKVIISENKGYVTCTCKNGYVGNGFQCKAKSDCRDDSCCASGYKWNKKDSVCVDVDECDDVTMNHCAPRNTCIDVRGNHLCKQTQPSKCNSATCDADQDCLLVDEVPRCVDPCQNYEVLFGPKRLSSTNSKGQFSTDRYLFGWFRYIGDEGVRMQEGCLAGGLKCGSAEPYTLQVGSHPALGDGIRLVPLFMNTVWSNSTNCTRSGSIKVKACPAPSSRSTYNGFYIYKFTGLLTFEVYCTDPKSTPLYPIPAAPVPTTTTTELITTKTSVSTTTTVPTTTTTIKPTTTTLTTTTKPPPVPTTKESRLPTLTTTTPQVSTAAPAPNIETTTTTAAPWPPKTLGPKVESLTTLHASPSTPTTTAKSSPPKPTTVAASAPELKTTASTLPSEQTSTVLASHESTKSAAPTREPTTTTTHLSEATTTTPTPHESIIIIAQPEPTTKLAPSVEPTTNAASLLTHEETTTALLQPLAEHSTTAPPLQETTATAASTPMPITTPLLPKQTNAVALPPELLTTAAPLPLNPTTTLTLSPESTTRRPPSQITTTLAPTLEPTNTAASPLLLPTTRPASPKPITTSNPPPRPTTTSVPPVEPNITAPPHATNDPTTIVPQSHELTTAATPSPRPVNTETPPPLLPESGPTLDKYTTAKSSPSTQRPMPNEPEIKPESVLDINSAPVKTENKGATPGPGTSSDHDTTKYRSTALELKSSGDLEIIEERFTTMEPESGGKPDITEEQATISEPEGSGELDTNKDQITTRATIGPNYVNSIEGSGNSDYSKDGFIPLF